MAVSTYTIKPAGGGDYTTIQAAYDAHIIGVDATNIPQFECYTGGDLGETTISLASQTFTTTANEPIKFYAASGEQHTGRLGTGCYITHTILPIGLYVQTAAYVEIDGIRVDSSEAPINSDSINVTNADGVDIRNCLTNSGESVNGINTHETRSTSETPTVTIVNNICVGHKGVATTGAGIVTSSSTISGDPVTTAYVYYNTTSGKAYGMYNWATVGGKGSGNPIMNVTASNNALFGATFCVLGVQLGAAVLNYVSCTNNMDSDNTANTVMSDASSQASKDKKMQFKSWDKWWELKYRADAIENGAYIASELEDCLGNTRDTTSPDIGACEWQELKVDIKEGVTINEGVTI